MAKEIAYQQELRNRMLAGIDTLARAVKVTLGPNGRNVVMHRKAEVHGAEYSDRAMRGAKVMAVNDGVTIAKSIVLSDPVENMGAQLMRDVASKANDDAGDGTTTATVLAQAILQESMRNITAGAHPLQLRKGIAAAADAAVTELRHMAIPVTTREEISNVAAISCQDADLGALVGEAIHTIGREGVVEVLESGRHETSLELLEGVIFDRGFQSPLMATDENHQAAELEHPYILLCDQKFSDPQDLIPALILVAQEDRPCLIISDGVEEAALGLILQNKVEGDLDVVCVQAPLYGDGRRWRMEDLAVLTGGAYITKELGLHIRDISLEHFGTADHVKVTRSRTVITNPGGDREAVEAHVQKLRYLASHESYDFNQKRHQERLAQFVSGVARIHVGGQTETEMLERKFRVEDAVNAARAACEEGMVPGGGVALLQAAAAVRSVIATLKGDERTGAQIVLRALEAPARQIAENSGLDASSFVGKLRRAKAGMGYDAEHGVWVDMREAGIMDPVKVTRLALESAASVAATLLTSEACVVETE